MVLPPLILTIGCSRPPQGTLLAALLSLHVRPLAVLPSQGFSARPESTIQSASARDRLHLPHVIRSTSTRDYVHAQHLEGSNLPHVYVLYVICLTSTSA